MLQEFADQLCRFSYDASAFQPFVPAVKAFHLIPIFPVYPDDLPTRNSPMIFHDLFLESIEELMSISPHSGIFLLLLPAATEPETYGREASHQGSADLPVSPQPASEGSQGPDHFITATP